MHISAQGRVSIPARIRRELGLGPGTLLVAYVEDGRIVLETREHLVRGIQATATADRPAGECVWTSSSPNGGWRRRASGIASRPDR